MINGIGIHSVYVLDQDVALDFYVGTLGFTVDTDVDMGFMRWLTIAPPGQPDRLILLEKPGPPALSDETAARIRDLVTQGAMPVTILSTDDCRGTHAALVARGVEFTQDPEDQPYGYRLCVPGPVRQCVANDPAHRRRPADRSRRHRPLGAGRVRWSAEHPGGHAGVRFVPMAVRLDKYLSSNHPDIAIAAALLFLAGLVDAIAFVVLKGSFVAFMSGNSTILGASTAAGGWSTIAVVAGLVAAFFGGAVGGAALGRWGGQHSPVWVLVAVTVTLLAGTVVALTASPTAGMIVVATATGAINSALSHTSTVPGGLTYVTGTLVKSAHELVASLGTDRPWAWLAVFWMWPVFVLGAVCGGFAERHWGVAGLWAGVAIAACTLLLRVAETLSRGNSRSDGTERAAG